MPNPTSNPEVRPVEPITAFIIEEIQARGWTGFQFTQRFAKEYGPKCESGQSQAALEMALLLALAPYEPVTITEEFTDALGRVFGTSGQFWANVHETHYIQNYKKPPTRSTRSGVGDG